MLLVTYQADGSRPGLAVDGRVYDLLSLLERIGAPPEAKPSVLQLIVDWSFWERFVREAHQIVGEGTVEPQHDARLLPPIAAPVRDAFAVAGNYSEHVVRSEARVGVAISERKKAVFFMKATGTFAGPQDAIEFDPSLTQAVDYEVELAVVLGRGGRDIPADQAMDHVFGYMVVNDVSARDLQIQPPQIDYFKGKSLDTFMPMGPGIVPRAALPRADDLVLRCRVNGEERQHGTTAQMIRDVPALISELSRGVTLLPGDILATGTPSGVALEGDPPEYLRDGDVVESEIEGIGILSNPVVARKA